MPDPKTDLAATVAGRRPAPGLPRGLSARRVRAVPACLAARLAALPGARHLRIGADAPAVLAAGLARALAGGGVLLLLLPAAGRGDVADFVPAAEIEGVIGIELFQDGTARLRLADGGTVMLTAEHVRVTASGEVLISLSAFDAELAALPLAAGFGLGNLATLGGLAAGVAAAAAGGEAGEDAGGATALGYVIDGYIVDARVFRDLDRDGVYDPGTEPATLTRGDGSFDLVAVPGAGPLHADGGYDLTTGRANSGRLSAPDGATVLTPLTTLVQARLEATGGTTPGSTAEAEAALRAALGLGEASLLTRDPMAEAEAGDSAALVAAARIVNVLHLADAMGADATLVAQALAAALVEAGADVLVDPAALARVLDAGYPAGSGANTAQVGALLAEAAPAAGAGIEAIENSVETVGVTLAGILREGASLPDGIAAVAEANFPFTPYLHGFTGVVTPADNAAGVAVSGRGQPGAAIRLSLGGLTQTATVDADGSWTVRFAPGAFAVEGWFEIAAVAEIPAGDLALTSRTVRQAVALDLVAAEIGGDTTARVVEDAGPLLTAAGLLTIRDTGPLAAAFQPQASVTGSHGTFTLAADGHWTYEAANDQPAIQALGAGIELVDRLTLQAVDGTEQQVTVTITGTNDVAAITGTATGAVTEDAAATLVAGGKLDVTDIDAGEAGFRAGSLGGAFGTFTLDSDGNWTYAADSSLPAIQALGAGAEMAASFTALALDGTGQTVTVTITGANDAATIAGQTTGSVTEDAGGTLVTAGTLVAVDPDAGEAAFRPQTVAGTNGFGIFRLETSGAWSYAAVNAQAAIQSLGGAATLTDSFMAVTADGTAEQTVTVTILGTNDAPTLSVSPPPGFSETPGTGPQDLGAAGLVTFDDRDDGDVVNIAPTLAGAPVWSSGGTLSPDLAQALVAGFSTSATGEPVPGATGWTFAAPGLDLGFLPAGQTIDWSYRITATDSAGAASETTLAFTIAGTNDAAQIGGTATGAVGESGNPTASGSLTISDADSGEAVFAPQAGHVTAFGTFSLTAEGAWTYTLDPDRPALDALGWRVVDEVIDIAAVDGTPAQVTVSVAATIDPVQAAGIEAGQGGFVIRGISAGDGSGGSVSGAGDVNGDGLADVIVGANGDDPSGSGSGAAFVVFGKTGGTPVQLSAVEAGTGGFAIRGVSAGDGAGISVSGAGDVNGDGLADVIVGANGDDPNGSGSGAAFVVFGKTGGAPVQLSAVDAGTGGFAIRGVSAGDGAGISVSGAGDVNGDGLADVIVGASGDDPNGSGSGAAFVVFGKTGGTPVQLSAVDAGTGGFAIRGVLANAQTGRSVSAAGDVNGDGLDDLIVGAHREGGGAAYVVFGKASGSAVQLSSVAAGTGGFAIKTSSGADWLGFTVSRAGDVNGDGREDLVVGARLANRPANGAGAAYVVFGKEDGQTVDVADLEAGQGGGFWIAAARTGHYVGNSVGAAGDVNGDGLDDLILGVRDSTNGSGADAALVVFGKADSAPVQTADVEAGHGGFRILGNSAGDSLGRGTGAAGDVNGDGFADVIVGAPGDDPNGDGSGASFAVFGGNVTGAVTAVGTPGADSLAGTGADDVIFAGLGDDTLSGGGGADRLSGGAGADIFMIGPEAGTVTLLDFDPGEGDRLDLSAFGLADFAAVEAALAPHGPGGHDTRLDLAGGDVVLLLADFAPGLLAAGHVILDA